MLLGCNRTSGLPPPSRLSSPRFRVRASSVGPSLRRIRPLSGRQWSLRVASLEHAAVEESVPGEPSQRSDAQQPVFKDGQTRANRPPFTLADIRNAIPKDCFQKNAIKSMFYAVLDLAIVSALAVVAYKINSPWLWPLYWVAQGTMFWALFVIGHDCGHQSFSTSKRLNDTVGLLVHSIIGVPYHGWRISHRTHHNNHGHVENDESWYPPTETQLKEMTAFGRVGRFHFPTMLLVYPFYLLWRSPGKTGSHFDPATDLFASFEGPMIRHSNACQLAWLGVLAVATWAFGIPAMIKLYLVPYLISVAWLDLVTYLHHHGPSDPQEEMPWYRGEEWSYMRGGLTTIDRDYGIFNKIHHDIGTHVVHHLFPQIPHYNLCRATEAAKKVLGDYYREPAPCPLGFLPFHLIPPLLRSLAQDHFVDDQGPVVFYRRAPGVNSWLQKLLPWLGGSKEAKRLS